jgi:hypothetical protein
MLRGRQAAGRLGGQQSELVDGLREVRGIRRESEQEHVRVPVTFLPESGDICEYSGGRPSRGPQGLGYDHDVEV